MIVGHRGAPGYRLEHTMASYELAYRLGADYVDVDLVPTWDGHLVARHENEIGTSTDVATRHHFAGRRSTKLIDGLSVTGWFTEDFTLAELKSMRATEPVPQLRPHNTVYNGQCEIVTYQEVLDLADRLTEELGRRLGTFPEVKHAAYFAGIGNPIEPELVDILRTRTLDRPDSPVVLQSFEVGTLRLLSERVRVPLLQLTADSGAPADFVAHGDPRGYAELVTAEALPGIARYASYLGPATSQLVDVHGDARLVTEAHAAGLRVVPYTLRNENAFLPARLRSSDDPREWGDFGSEYRRVLDTGVDGVFTDQPDTVAEFVKAR